MRVFYNDYFGFRNTQKPKQFLVQKGFGLLHKKGVIGITGKVVSYNLGENILFDQMNYGENILILYSNTANHQQIFRNFISQMAHDDVLQVYLSHNSNKLDFGFKIRNFNFNVITEDVLHELKSQLDQCFKEREEKNKEMCLVSDWSGANLRNCPTFSTFLEELIKKSQEIG